MNKNNIKKIILFIVCIFINTTVFAAEKSVCNIPETLRVIKIVGIVMLLIRIAVPIMLIIFGMLDFVKVITSGSDDFKKSLSSFVERPTFINIILSITGNLDLNAGYDSCKQCLFSPFSCKITGKTDVYGDDDIYNNSNNSNSNADNNTSNDNKSYFGQNGYKWGWKDGKLVYYDNSGNIIKNKTFNINGVSYKADSSGNVTSSRSNPYMTTAYSKQTNAIVNAHRYDFDVDTFNKVISSYGGYENYVKSLGGVFTKYANVRRANIKTKAEFKEIAEYVFGMMNMYGFEYSNSSTSNSFKNWGGKNNMTSDAFYYPKRNDTSYIRNVHSKSNATSSTSGKIANLSIDDVLSGNGNGMSIQCTGGVTFILKKAGLIPQNAPTIESEFYHYYSNNDSNKYYRKYLDAKLTPNMSVKDMQVGDVIGFYKNGYSYYHVAMVVSVSDKNIQIYDSGSKFTNKRSGVITISRNSSLSSKYGYSRYVVMRMPLGLQ